MSLSDLASLTTRKVRSLTDFLFRSQATQKSSKTIINQIIKSEGMRGFYRGYVSTLSRELPFSFIQFPLWEYLKQCRREQTNRNELSFIESGTCGAISGALAASTTTPLDVAKTRIMLAQRNDAEASQSSLKVLTHIYREEGARALYAGVKLRTFWITIGGFIYLGALEQFKNMLDKV